MATRHSIGRLLLKSSCSLTGCQSPGDYRTRVFGGPLRGSTFCMPALERLSFALGTYERHVVQCMKSHVRAGMVAYDIGANAGYMTLVLSKLVGSDGKVVAFEPDPRNAMVISRNVSCNDVRNVTLLRRAVSDQNGEVTFATFGYSLVGHIARDGTPADANLITVSSSTLDDLVFQEGMPTPQFIKIDVEGAEDRVIRGCLRLLEEARPVVVTEIWNENRNEVSMLFKNRGYREMQVTGGPATVDFSDVLFVPC